MVWGGVYTCWALARLKRNNWRSRYKGSRKRQALGAFFLAKSGQRRACVKYVSFVIWLRGLCRGSGATWGAEYVEQAPGLHGIVDGSEGIMPTSRQWNACWAVILYQHLDDLDLGWFRMIPCLLDVAVLVSLVSKLCMQFHLVSRLRHPGKKLKDHCPSCRPLGPQTHWLTLHMSHWKNMKKP